VDYIGSDQLMSYAVQRAMVWCGLPLMVLTFSGFLLARLLPVPPGANLTADQIAEFYSAHPTTTRLGLLLATIGLGLLGPMVAVITSQMLRIKDAPAALANCQQIGGIGVVMVTVLPLIVMNVAAFRPDRNPIVTQAINDLAWLLLVTPIGLFLLQEIPIAIAIFLDRSTKPVFPRWVGYANLWIPVTFLPAFLPYFTKTGPVAWQGILVFYLGLTTFGAWVIIMMWALLRALRDQAATELTAAVPTLTSS
jgi:hypothetical protein